MLNEQCLCTRSDHQALSELLRDRGLSQACALVAQPSLFAEFPVFVADAEVATMQSVVAAIKKVAGHPAFIERALGQAPAIAAIEQGTQGVLYGYDFHLTEQGPKLIEVNTNAGGILLNHALSRAQRPCCDAVDPMLGHPSKGGDLDAKLVESFRSEFRAARGADAQLRVIAIVDEQPQGQFLLPEFQLFAELFRRADIDAHIADPSELQLRDGALWLGDVRVDLVYNRLTDFYLAAPANAHLAAAYASGAVVLTPHPRAHALFANKHHLEFWSREENLRGLDLDEATIRTLLGALPAAEIVSAQNRERLWNERKHFFFKPACGYASKAAYRGDKVSKATFQEQVKDGYLAQELVKPSERVVRVNGELTKLKLDVRAYVDQGEIVLLAARLYQGQTTNFRTPGGGFAAVLEWPARQCESGLNVL